MGSVMPAVRIVNAINADFVAQHLSGSEVAILSVLNKHRRRRAIDPAAGCWENTKRIKLKWDIAYAPQIMLRFGWLPWITWSPNGGISKAAKPIYCWSWFL